MAGRLERGPSPPRRKPLGNLGEKREVPLGAVEPLAQRALAVELAARDLEPHRVRRVHGQVGRGRDALEGRGGGAPADAARGLGAVPRRLVTRAPTREPRRAGARTTADAT